MSESDGNMARLGDFTIGGWVRSIPKITRVLFVGTFCLTVLILFGIFPIWPVAMSWYLVVFRFQIWRPILNIFFAARSGFSFLFHMYFLYQYSYQLEMSVFYGRLDEYSWMLVVVVGLMYLSALLFPFRFYGPGLVVAMVHVWGRSFPNAWVSLYGIIRIPARYLSLVMIAVDFLIDQGIEGAVLAGLFAGHFYYFVRTEFPTMPSGWDLLRTPARFSRFVDYLDAKCTGRDRPPRPLAPWSRNAVPSPSPAGRGQEGSTGARTNLTTPQMRPRAHEWGRGRTLGDS